MKLVKNLLVSLLLVSLIGFKVLALESLYYVYDTKSDLNESFETYKEALSFYNKHLDEAENLILKQDDKVIKMEYGAVIFKEELVKYYSLTKGYNDYFDGRYGIDGAYLQTLDEEVEFIISGDRGLIALAEVELIPYEELKTSLSSYTCKNNQLYHNIKTSINNDYYAYSILVGDKLAYLENNKTYFSYDGNYFYSNYEDMIDDYLSDEFLLSINNESPYYNYYQYLPYRSLSNYSADQLDAYIEEGLGINGRLNSYFDSDLDGANDYVNKSELYKIGNTLENLQYIYGVNSAMLLANAIVDSYYGKSLDAYFKKSLFSNYAFTSVNERMNGKYESIASSVYSYARNFIGNSYSNIYADDYAGTYFGNKAGGINVIASLDPYYGEKCASAYYKIDKYLGSNDDNSYELVLTEKDISIYEDEKLTKEKYEINNPNIVLSIMEELDNAYAVRIDYTNDNDFYYDLKKFYYVAKEDIKVLNNSNKKESLNEYNYDFNEGSYFKAKTMKVYADAQLNIVPTKDNYEFIKFNNDNVAQYKQIVNVEVKENFKKNYFVGEYLDLTGGKLKITYKDGSNKLVELNNDYLGFYSPEVAGTFALEINYCGFTTTYEINYVEDENANKINELLTDLNYEKALQIKKLLKDSSYNLTVEQIKIIDKVLLENGYGYHIYSNDSDISISGMALALDYPLISSLIYDDTYYLSIEDLNTNSYKYLTNFASKYGFEVVDSYKISFALNYNKTRLQTPIVLQSRIDKKANKVYSVYHLDADGNVKKCKTTISENYVQYVAYEEGTYMVLSLDSFNSYPFEDEILNVNKTNNSQDNHDIIRQVFLFTVLMLIGFINVFVYYKYVIEKERKWTGYKKLLRAQVSALAEKPKN